MSDEEQLSSESDIDKRAYHNLLERKRRDHIKDSFTGLRDVLPTFKSAKGEKVRASRAQILKKTADYINSHRKRVKIDTREINQIRQENARMEEQIRIIKASLDSGNLKDALPVINALQDLSSESSSSDEEEAEGDKQEDDDEWSTESDDEESGGYATDMSSAQQVQA